MMLVHEYMDDYRTQGLRRQLVSQVAAKGISNQRVLDALMAVPRHFFLDQALDKIAYEDRAFPIGEGQTISQPFTVCYQTELLDVNPGHKVLEIGTGSGYQASILAEMGAIVHTIERQSKLYEKILQQYPLTARYPHLHFYLGDGFLGLADQAPFDKVLVTAAAPFIPMELIRQLKPGGCMVIPVNEGEGQRMKRVLKHSENEFTEELYEMFRFVPMLQGKT